MGYTPRTEKTKDHDLIFIYNGDKLKLDANIYKQTMSKAILYTVTYTSGGTAEYKYMNGGVLKATGLEWSIKYSLLDENKLDVYWAGTLAKYCGERISAVTSDASPRIAEGNDILLIPRFTSNMGFDWKPMDIVTLSPSMRMYDKMTYVTSQGYTDTCGLKTYFDLCVRTKKFFKDTVDFSFTCLNLADNNRKVPARGEITYNQGVMEPEPRRFFFQVRANF